MHSIGNQWSPPQASPTKDGRATDSCSNYVWCCRSSHVRSCVGLIVNSIFDEQRHNCWWIHNSRRTCQLLTRSWSSGQRLRFKMSAIEYLSCVLLIRLQLRIYMCRWYKSAQVQLASESATHRLHWGHDGCATVICLLPRLSHCLGSSLNRFLPMDGNRATNHACRTSGHCLVCIEYLNSIAHQLNCLWEQAVLHI